jgi:hypothetical protein
MPKPSTSKTGYPLHLPQKGYNPDLPSIPLSLQKEILPAPPTYSEHVLPPGPHPYNFPLMQMNREEKELILIQVIKLILTVYVGSNYILNTVVVSLTTSYDKLT